MNCPFCNQTLPDGAVFCGFCGNKLTGAAQEANAAQPVVDEAAENLAQNFEFTGSVITDTAASFETAGAAAFGTAENVIPDMQNTMQNGSAVNLGKNDYAAAPGETGQTPAPGNNIADQVREGFQNVASSLQNDTQEAVAAVKNRNFKELLKNKTFLICCGAVIAVIILVVIIICVSSSGSSHKIKGGYYRVTDSGDAIYFYNGSVIKGVDMTEASYIIAVSLDGTVALVKDSEDLYILDNGKAKLITDELDTRNVSISANGKTVAYASDDAVYVYTGSKSKKIADLENADSCKPVISPDGKVVAFSDYDDDDIKAYAWKGSKVIDLDADIIPYSVSNGGKMIFGEIPHYDSFGFKSYDLYYLENLKKGSEQKIESDISVSGISFDHTKLLYYHDGSTYCFDASLDDEDGMRIIRGDVSPVSDFLYQDSIPYIDNFKEFYGIKDWNIYRCFRKGKSYDNEKFISDVDGFTLSEDGKSFAYIDEDDLVKGTLSNAKNAKKVGKEVYSFRANDSLSHIFYLDEDDNLRYVGKDGKIASDVDGYLVTDGGVCVFSDIDDELYYSSKGGEKKKVGLEEISSMAIRNNVVYVVSDDELYTSKDGKSFKKTGVDVG